MESLAEIKSGLHHYIAETDDVKILSKLKKFVSELLDNEDKIVAFTSDGRALTRSAYKADIDQAIKQAESGNVVSIEDMRKNL